MRANETTAVYRDVLLRIIVEADAGHDSLPVWLDTELICGAAVAQYQQQRQVAQPPRDPGKPHA